MENMNFKTSVKKNVEVDVQLFAYFETDRFYFKFINRAYLLQVTKPNQMRPDGYGTNGIVFSLVDTLINVFSEEVKECTKADFNAAFDKTTKILKSFAI
jgi:hypothetical protein